MFSFLWNTALINPIVNSLVALYKVTGNLGLAIILLTILIRLVLIPVMAPTMKTMKKQQALQPEIRKLKEKYKGDQQKFAAAQMELFKEHGINPASGCLSQIVMLMVLIALYSVIQLISVKGDINLINQKIYVDNLRLLPGQQIETHFGYMDLAKPDPLFILAVLSGILQFVASKMMMPIMEKAEKAAEITPSQADDIALQMQQQSLYMMPIMNVVIGVTLPAGVVLYIVVTTIFTVVQNYFTNGWGGMKPFINKLKFAKR